MRWYVQLLLVLLAMVAASAIFTKTTGCTYGGSKLYGGTGITCPQR